MIPHFSAPLLAHCEFVRTATVATLTFDLVLILGSVATFFFLKRFTTHIESRFLVMGIGVAIFEMFTGPMWLNERLGMWAYIYTDVSWILTLGWTSLILATVVLVDRFLPRWNAAKRFAMSMLLLLVPVIIAEMVTVKLGIRSYAPEVQRVVSGIYFAGVPIEILYYVPVFTALVIAFYKYWSFYFDDAALVPVKKRRWLRAVSLAFIAVFMFELLVEPMVSNANFPKWSYIYHDISILLTALWVLLIAISAVVVGRWLLHLSLPQRFVSGVFIISALALPVESWLIQNGYRVYGHSAVSNFTGYTTFITGVPIEVAFAIPCYLSLIVAFIRYWEIVLDNNL